MEKLDLKKSLKHLYAPSPKLVVEVEVPEMRFLMVDGQGDPNTPPFQEAITVLYSLAYTLKFTFKKEQGIDYPVMPLEGLWWADDPAAFSSGEKDAWQWTAMIMQPDFITEDSLEKARAEVGKKKSISRLSAARLEDLREGRAAQIMHIGPYAEEAPTIKKIHRFIEEQGGRVRGKHHEIYLGDPRRTDPARLKTVLRQPFA